MSFDHRIFYLINKGLACSFLDAAMPTITYLGDKKFLVAALCVLLVFAKKNLRRTAFLSLISFVTSALSVALLKGIFARPRPAAVMLDVRLLGDNGLTHSFPS